MSRKKEGIKSILLDMEKEETNIPYDFSGDFNKKLLDKIKQKEKKAKRTSDRINRVFAVILLLLFLCLTRLYG